MQGDWHRASKLDQYLAAIRYDLARTRAKDPGSLKLKDFLLSFAQQQETPLTKKQLQELRKQRAEHSKSAWMMLAAAGATRVAQTKKK